MNYIVLDLEFNQFYPFKSGIKKSVVDLCPFEIIQIGAVKLNEQFEIIEEFNTLIEPKIYPRLHPFVEKITGLKQQNLRNQPLFIEAFQNFVEFIGIDDSILCSWGGDDIKSLFRNILYYDIDENCITHKYINIQTFASKFLNAELGKTIGLKNAAEELNIEMNLTFHNALHDAIYTAKIFKLVKPTIITPVEFQPKTFVAPKIKPPKTNIAELYQHVASALDLEELNPEQRRLVKASYFLGRKHAFDYAPTTKGKIKK